MEIKISTRTIDGIKFSYLNQEEFEAIYKSIFKKKKFNDFKINHDSPLILDCGAHIGLTILYFKQLFPRAKIIAFEPDPIIFKVLGKNVDQNNLKNVRLVNTALSDKKGTETLFAGRTRDMLTWGNAIVKNPWYDSLRFRAIKVPSFKLSSFVAQQKVDLIKLNIEGAEGRVLKEIENKLSKVNEIVMEFHGNSTNNSNNIGDILLILEKNSFSYIIKQNYKLINPEQIEKSDPYWLIIHAYTKHL